MKILRLFAVILFCFSLSATKAQFFIPPINVISNTNQSCAAISNTDNDAQVGSTASATFIGKNIGTADSTRQILVEVYSERATGTNSPVTSMTVGGISATSIIAATNSTENSEIWIVAVPTGITATTVVNFATANALAVGIGVYRMTGANATPTATGSSTASTPAASININVNACGAAIAGSVQRNNTATTFTWTGTSKDFDQTTDAADIYAGGSSAIFALAQTPLTVVSTASQAGVRSNITAAASFPHL